MDIDNKFLKRADISILRILAAIAVIILHTGSTLFFNPNLFEMNNSQNIFFRSMADIMRWSVPVFIMITGALLLKDNKKITPEICIKKYSLRVIIALFVFGTVFAAMEIFFDTKALSVSMIFQSLIRVIDGTTWGHFWYLYMLFGIYLFLPVIKHFTENTSRAEMRYVLIVLFIFSSCLPVLSEIFNIDIAFEKWLSRIDIFYLLLGKYLDDEIPLLLRNKKINILIIFLLSLFIIVVYNLFYVPADYEKVKSSFFDIGHPIVVLIAALIFSTFKGVNINEKFKGLLWKIDRLCFGVYIIHMLFIHFIYKFLKITPLSFQCFPVLTMVFIVIFVVLSFTASYIMSLIPPLKKYIL